MKLAFALHLGEYADETAAFEKSLTSRQAKILFYNSQVTDPTRNVIPVPSKRPNVSFDRVAI